MSQAPAILSSHTDGLVERADFFRVGATCKLDPSRRTTLGQFLTPALVARLMASMFKQQREHVDLLDAGAGAGVLTAAFTEEMIRWANRPASVCRCASGLEAAPQPLSWLSFAGSVFFS